MCGHRQFIIALSPYSPTKIHITWRGEPFSMVLHDDVCYWLAHDIRKEILFMFIASVAADPTTRRKISSYVRLCVCVWQGFSPFPFRAYDSRTLRWDCAERAFFIRRRKDLFMEAFNEPLPLHDSVRFCFTYVFVNSVIGMRRVKQIFDGWARMKFAEIRSNPRNHWIDCEQFKRSLVAFCRFKVYELESRIYMTVWRNVYTA